MRKRTLKEEEREKGSHKKNQVFTKIMILLSTRAATALSTEAKYSKYLSEHPGRHSGHLIDINVN